MNNLEKKYLKYKIKYLKLKSQIGGLDRSQLYIKPTNIYKIVDSSSIEHKFKLIKKLGKGTSGTVNLIQNTDTLENRIIKISNRNDANTNENILFEAEFLEDLNKYVSGYCTYKSHYYGTITPFSLKSGTVKKVVIAPLELNPF